MCGGKANEHAHLAPGQMAVTVLEDGRIRVQTGSFAGVEHMNADKFFRSLLLELGVIVDTRVPLAHTMISHGQGHVIIVGGKH